jgi:hypothetical protein
MQQAQMGTPQRERILAEIATENSVPPGALRAEKTLKSIGLIRGF